MLYNEKQLERMKVWSVLVCLRAIWQPPKIEQFEFEEEERTENWKKARTSIVLSRSHIHTCCATYFPHSSNNANVKTHIEKEVKEKFWILFEYVMCKLRYINLSSKMWVRVCMDCICTNRWFQWLFKCIKLKNKYRSISLSFIASELPYFIIGKNQRAK